LPGKLYTANFSTEHLIVTQLDNMKGPYFRLAKLQGGGEGEQIECNDTLQPEKRKREQKYDANNLLNDRCKCVRIRHF
jgi:hypothetical protein